MSQSEVREFIESEISSHQVVVWAKSFCPHSAKVKALFKSLQDEGVSIDIAIHDLDLMSNGSQIQNELLQMTGQSTVPNVFVAGSHIGGNDDTQKLHLEGKLIKLITGSD